MTRSASQLSIESSSSRAREALFGLLLALSLALPVLLGAREHHAPLMWLALLALPLGSVLERRASSGRAHWIVAAAVIAVLLGFARRPLDWQRLLATELGLLGLMALGAALTVLLRRRPQSALAAAALLAALSTLAPSARGWLCGEPWPPAVAARLLDLSVLSLTLESFGVDWMRHPWVYDSVGASSIDPELRLAWGRLAGPLVFLVGCVVLLGARRSLTTGSMASLEGNSNDRHAP